MREAILNFAKQFAYTPEVNNAGGLPRKKRLIIAGMGGSHLSGDVLMALKPERVAAVHSNYGLPQLSEEDLRDSLVVCSSYSGNTEETLDAYETARVRGLAVAVIATGGKLLAQAKKDAVPFVELPQTGVVPRCALGFSFMALLKLASEEELLAQAAELAGNLDAEASEAAGKGLAEKLRNKIPIIYAAERNATLAYNWKIRFNETGRIPAFYNVFPEMNHNELDGFEAREATADLSRNFYFLFLKDSDDDPRIAKRMAALEKILKDKNLPVEILSLSGDNKMQRVFASVVLADWTSYYAAEWYGIKQDEAPLVERFKKIIGQ